MSIYLDRFNKFLALLQQKDPEINIKFKNESWFMKLLGKISFFNKNFMTTFTTVVGKTIYLPSREYLENSPGYGPLTILAHEYRHMCDFKKWWQAIFSRIGYFAPQILAPLMLLFLLLPISFAISVPLAIVLFLGMLAPIPSPVRKYYELKGYTTSLFIANELYKERGWNELQRKYFLDEGALFMNKQFTGPYYYYMWPWGVAPAFEVIIDKILKEELEKEDPFYLEMKETISNSK